MRSREDNWLGMGVGGIRSQRLTTPHKGRVLESASSQRRREPFFKCKVQWKTPSPGGWLMTAAPRLLLLTVVRLREEGSRLRH